MTSDFDELASAYLDGEATESDAARVESDEDLQALVGELRAVSDALTVDVGPPDEVLKRRQIGAALDAFDSLVGPARSDDDVDADDPAPGEAEGMQTGTAPIDLDHRRKVRSQPAAGPGGLPRWLSVAAVLLLVVGGVGLLAQLGDDSNGDLEAATEAVDSGDDAADDGEASAESVEADGVAQEAPVAADSFDEGDGDDAQADFVAEDETTAEESAASADEQAEAASAEDAAGAPTTTSRRTTTGGFFPEDQLEAATVEFAAVPDQDDLVALADGPRFDPILAECAKEIEAEVGEVLFFVPVSVDGVDGEALFTGSDLDPVVVLVDGNCEPMG